MVEVMADADIMDTVSEKECRGLAGLFQQIAKDSKAGLPLFDELLIKTTKLQVQIKAAMTTLGSFLDTFQKIADNASNTKGSSRDIGICLTRIILRHRALETQINAYSSCLLSSLVVPMRSKTVEWKKVVNSLDKEHSKEFKRSRKSIKRKIEYIMKLKKKARKAPSPQLTRLIEQASQDLHIKYKVLEEQEQQAVRRINSQERSHYCCLAACLKPVIKEEYNMMGEIQKLDEVMDKLGRVTADPHNVTDTADQVIRDMKAAGEAFSFVTPPSTPGIGSRRGSVRSLNSLASSRASSSTSLQNDKDGSLTRDSSCGTLSRRKPSEGSKRYSGMSYRSQESQEISFHRPGSALSNMSKESGERRGRSTSRQGPGGDQNQIFSTIRRASSPFRRPALPGPPPSDCGKVTRRPPLPHRYQQDKADQGMSRKEHDEEDGRRSESPEKSLQEGTMEGSRENKTPCHTNPFHSTLPLNPSNPSQPSSPDDPIYQSVHSVLRPPIGAQSSFQPPPTRPTKLEFHPNENLSSINSLNQNYQPIQSSNLDFPPNQCSNLDYQSSNLDYQPILSLLNNYNAFYQSAPTTYHQSSSPTYQSSNFSRPPTQPESHYAVPRSNLKIPFAPDFNLRRPTLLTPQRVYSNTAEVKTAANTEESQTGSCFDQEIKTPTEEGAKLEEGSTTSSSGSIGSSSGYGSQLTVLRVEEPLDAVLQSLENGFDGGDSSQSTYPKFATFNKTTHAPSRSSSFNQADANFHPAGESVPISIRRRSTGFANKPPLQSLNIHHNLQQDQIQENRSSQSWESPSLGQASPEPWNFPSPDKITLEPWDLPGISNTEIKRLSSSEKIPSPSSSFPEITFPDLSELERIASSPSKDSPKPWNRLSPSKDSPQPWKLPSPEKDPSPPWTVPSPDKASPNPWIRSSPDKVSTESWSLPSPNKIYTTSSPQPWRHPSPDNEEASSSDSNESFPPPPPHLLSLQDPESFCDPSHTEMSNLPKSSAGVKVQTLRRSLSIGANAPTSTLQRQDPRYRSISRIPSSPSTIKGLATSQATQSANLIRALNDRLKTQIPRPNTGKLQSKSARPLYDRISQASGIPAPKFGAGSNNSSRMVQSRCNNPVSRK